MNSNQEMLVYGAIWGGVILICTSIGAVISLPLLVGGLLLHFAFGKKRLKLKPRSTLPVIFV